MFEIFFQIYTLHVQSFPWIWFFEKNFPFVYFFTSLVWNGPINNKVVSDHRNQYAITRLHEETIFSYTESSRFIRLMKSQSRYEYFQNHSS